MDAFSIRYDVGRHPDRQPHGLHHPKPLGPVGEWVKLALCVLSAAEVQAAIPLVPLALGCLEAAQQSRSQQPCGIRRSSTVHLFPQAAGDG